MTTTIPIYPRYPDDSDDERHISTYRETYRNYDPRDDSDMVEYNTSDMQEYREPSRDLIDLNSPPLPPAVVPIPAPQDDVGPRPGYARPRVDNGPTLGAPFPTCPLYPSYAAYDAERRTPRVLGTRPTS